MPRQLNPRFLESVLENKELRGLEFLLILGGPLGVIDKFDEFLPAGSGSDPVLYQKFKSDLMNYRGWRVPGKLYCLKCKALIAGVPAEILKTNCCSECCQMFYDPADHARLDYLGYELYKDRVKRYTAVALGKRFLHLIPGHEHLWNGGRVDKGFHIDHVYSIRSGFNGDLPAELLSFPANLRVIESRHNMSKGMKCDLHLDDLLHFYEKFQKDYPEWAEKLRKVDEKEETYVLDEAKLNEW